MKTTCLCAALFALTLAGAAGQANKLANDPLTGLPLSPVVVSNEPHKMPDAQVCKSNMQGNFYSLSNILNCFGATLAVGLLSLAYFASLTPVWQRFAASAVG